MSYQHDYLFTIYMQEHPLLCKDLDAIAKHLTDLFNQYFKTQEYEFEADYDQGLFMTCWPSKNPNEQDGDSLKMLQVNIEIDTQITGLLVHHPDEDSNEETLRKTQEKADNFVKGPKSIFLEPYMNKSSLTDRIQLLNRKIFAAHKQLYKLRSLQTELSDLLIIDTENKLHSQATKNLTEKQRSTLQKNITKIKQEISEVEASFAFKDYSLQPWIQRIQQLEALHNNDSYHTNKQRARTVLVAEGGAPVWSHEEFVLLQQALRAHNVLIKTIMKY